MPTPTSIRPPSHVDPAPSAKATPVLAAVPNDGTAFRSGRRIPIPIEQSELEPEPQAFFGDFTPEFTAKFFELIEDGNTLTSVSTMPNMPSRAFIRGWMKKDRQFEVNYLVACRNRADARADKLDELNTQMENGDIHPEVAREIARNHRFLMSKENAHKYGEKLQAAVRHTVTVAPAQKAVDWSHYIEGQADDDAQSDD